jgi:formylglycine-generating enzyme required for sulfatase activity
VVIEIVSVGDPGDSPDDEVTWTDNTTGYGGVDYVYNIGKFEVTAGQYTDFLNAVAATDTYGLYNEQMWNSSEGCKIERTDLSGSYWHWVAPDWANRPVNFVSWGDAARFANWLHNGQPTGAQDLSTTEDGSYFLNGATTDAALMEIDREPDATWVIPAEDEWYKAAYHYNDGVRGGYYDYPTSSDIIPSNDLADPGNSANFYLGDHAVGSPYWRTEAGEFENSGSPYGTFDQGGNVREWNETVIGSYRGVRGGSFFRYYGFLHAGSRLSAHPPLEVGELGFRVAEVSEPNCAHDGDGDGDIDLYDYALWQRAFTGPR